jgi:hypothetical protein
MWLSVNKVTEGKRAGLPVVSINIKGSTTGAHTDVDAIINLASCEFDFNF